MKFKNYRNRYNRRNQIISEEEFLDMSLQKIFDKENDILAQYNQIGLPTNEELSASPNTQFVEPFINELGQQDGNYWASCIKPQVNSSLQIQSDINNNNQQIQGNEDLQNLQAQNSNFINSTEQQLLNSKLQNSTPTLKELATQFIQENPLNHLLQNISTEKQNASINNINETLTGGAAQVNNKISENNNLKNREMYIEKAPLKENGPEILQGNIAKNIPTDFGRSDAEYYKIALNLENIRKSGQIPDWFKENNELFTLGESNNKGLVNFLEKIILNANREQGKNISKQELLNTDLVIAKPSSNVGQMLQDSDTLKDFVKSHIDLIKSGKLREAGIGGLRFERPAGTTLVSTKSILPNTLHYASIYGAKMINEHTVQLNIVDYYDFAPGGGSLNNNAYIQQENGKLRRYALVIPVTVKI